MSGTLRFEPQGIRSRASSLSGSLAPYARVTFNRRYEVCPGTPQLHHDRAVSSMGSALLGYKSSASGDAGALRSIASAMQEADAALASGMGGAF